MSSTPATFTSTSPHAFINGIDIHNAPPTHEANAATLRKWPFQRNIFNTLARSTGLFQPFMAALGAVFNGATRTIPLLEWQLIVLRLSGKLGAEYEFRVNEPVARFYDLGDEKIAALYKGLKPEELFETDGGKWSERQRCVVKLVDESMATFTNTEETMEWAKRLMSEDEVVEVLIVLGMYATIARVTMGLRIQMDPEIPDLVKFIPGGVTKNAQDP